MKQTFDSIIVGAGMVGAALASGLAQQGISVALIDQSSPMPYQPGDSPDIRVSALSAGSERYLDSLGALAQDYGHASDPVSPPGGLG